MLTAVKASLLKFVLTKDPRGVFINSAWFQVKSGGGEGGGGGGHGRIIQERGGRGKRGTKKGLRQRGWKGVRTQPCSRWRIITGGRSTLLGEEVLLLTLVS